MRKLIAAEYCRYSSSAQDDGYSIEAQQRAIANFALSNNYDVRYSYIDKAKSGTNVRHRTEFQQMMKDAEQGLFDVVIVHKLDRFSRNRYDSIKYRNFLTMNGVRLISVLENFGESAEAELMWGINETYNEFYSRNLSREVRKGMGILASRGCHCGGNTPPTLRQLLNAFR